MNTKYLLLLASLFFTLSLFAQNSESFKTFKMESIYLKNGKFIKNGVEYPVGFFGENLKEEMKISPHAINEWNKYVKFRNWSFITSFSGLVLTVASLGVEQNKNRANLLIAGLSLTIASIPLSIKSGNQLGKSIWTHNRDLFL